MARYMQCNNNELLGSKDINNTKNKKNKNLNIHTKPLWDTFELPEHKLDI